MTGSTMNTNELIDWDDTSGNGPSDDSSEYASGNDAEKLRNERGLWSSRQSFILAAMGSAIGWGTDFSYEYVRINAEYTT